MCLLENDRSRTMFRVVLVSLLLFGLMQLPMRLQPDFHPNLMDGLRGAFLGVAIGALAVMSWRRRRGTPGR